jgi:methyl-accepting chemotaxis protein
MLKLLINKQRANHAGQVEAIMKSQAVIEFDMNGNILHANPNFLSAVG